MHQRRVGSSGLALSTLALGTRHWGHGVDEHEARDLVATYLDSGGTTLALHPGEDEAPLRIAGSVIRDLGVRREMVLTLSCPGSSRRSFTDTLGVSLTALGLDGVELLIAHPDEAEAPVAETVAALEAAVTSGQGLYAGWASGTGWQLGVAATLAASWPQGAPLCVVVDDLSLGDRHAETELLPAAASLGLGFLAHFPGFDASSPFSEAVHRAADGLDWSPAQVCLAWVKGRSGVSSTVVEPRRVSELVDALSVEFLTLPHEISDALDDVSIGP